MAATMDRTATLFPAFDQCFGSDGSVGRFATATAPSSSFKVTLAICYLLLLPSCNLPMPSSLSAKLRLSFFGGEPMIPRAVQIAKNYWHEKQRGDGGEY